MLLFPGPHGYKLITFLGRSNLAEKTPDNLDFIAEEGNGLYENTRDIFGPKVAGLMSGVSLETMDLGLLYFRAFPGWEEALRTTLRLLNVGDNKEYKAFSLRSSDLEQGFITQVRIVSDSAMKSYYGIGERRELRSAENEQSVGIHDAIVAFVASERQTFGGEVELCRHLGIEVPFDGSFGLGFAFLVENSYYRIYRVWSRAVYYSK